MLERYESINVALRKNAHHSSVIKFYTIIMKHAKLSRTKTVTEFAIPQSHSAFCVRNVLIYNCMETGERFRLAALNIFKR
jgi:hypothetical protein